MLAFLVENAKHEANSETVQPIFQKLQAFYKDGFHSPTNPSRSSTPHKQHFETKKVTDQLVGRAVTRSSLEREVYGLHFEPVKSDSAANGSPPLRHFFDRSCFACKAGAMTLKWARQLATRFGVIQRAIK